MKKRWSMNGHFMTSQIARLRIDHRPAPEPGSVVSHLCPVCLPHQSLVVWGGHRPATIMPGLLMSGLVALFALSGRGHPARHPRGCYFVVRGRAAGALSGLVAAMTVFLIVVAPTQCLASDHSHVQFSAALNAELPQSRAGQVHAASAGVRLHARSARACCWPVCSSAGCWAASPGVRGAINATSR